MTLDSMLASRKIFYVVLLLATFVVYGNTFWNEWTYDDLPVVVENPDIRSLENFSKNTYPSRPLRELSYMLDYKLFGTQPAGYHLQQILWHAANGCLLFFLIGLFGVPPAYALLGALLFLFHPIQVESVASIGHRKELLPLFFGLLMMIFYIKSLAAAGIKRWMLWLGCLCAYLLALLGNLTVGTLPLLLPLYEALFVEKERRILTRYPALCGLVVMTAVVGVGCYFVLNHDYSDMVSKMYVHNSFSETRDYYPMLLAVVKIPLLYLGKILWPFALAPEYVVSFSANYLQWGSVFGIGFIVVLLTAAWRSRKKMPLLSLGIAWSLVLYLPVAHIVPIYAYAMADRYMYMVLPGLALAVAALLYKANLRLLNSCAVFVLVGLTVLTVVQNAHWRNNYSLWSHSVAVNPESKGANWGMAHAHLKAGEYKEAESLFHKVLELDRFFLNAYLELAKLQEMAGDRSEAKKNYELFVRYAQYQSPVEAMRVKRYLQLRFK